MMFKLVTHLPPTIKNNKGPISWFVSSNDTGEIGTTYKVTNKDWKKIIQACVDDKLFLSTYIAT